MKKIIRKILRWIDNKHHWTMRKIHFVHPHLKDSHTTTFHHKYNVGDKVWVKYKEPKELTVDEVEYTITSDDCILQYTADLIRGFEERDLFPSLEALKEYCKSYNNDNR